MLCVIKTRSSKNYKTDFVQKTFISDQNRFTQSYLEKTPFSTSTPIFPKDFF